jgi:hypothetical protein
MRDFLWLKTPVKLRGLPYLQAAEEAARLAEADEDED